jgi:hypothetical protein
MDKTWVEIGAGLEGDSLKQFNKFPKGIGVVLAVFVGTFDAGGPYGDGGYRFKITVDRIESVERISRSSGRQDDPSWVPKSCKSSVTTPTGVPSCTVLHEMLQSKNAD